jgi:hypothetical protein
MDWRAAPVSDSNGPVFEPLRKLKLFEISTENGFAEIYSNDRHLLAAASFFGLRPVNLIT